MQPVNPPPATTRPAVVPHVHVRAGGCDIAIPIEQVRQAVPLRPQGLMALPRRTGALLGVAQEAARLKVLDEVGLLPAPLPDCWHHLPEDAQQWLQEARGQNAAESADN